MSSRLVGNTHIVAGGPEVLGAVTSFLEEEGMRVQGNIDAYVRVYRQFGIQEARELRERAALRPLGDLPRSKTRRRVFVVAAPDIGREAQNALLKTLEEPPADALFVFIVPTPETLLPTFRSRTHMLSLDHVGSLTDIEAQKFLAAPAKQRLDVLKQLLEKGEDDKRDLSKILEFLAGIERLLAKHPKDEQMAHREGLKSARGEGLEAVYRARKYLADKGALVKPLLEQVALLVPRV